MARPCRTGLTIEFMLPTESTFHGSYFDGREGGKNDFAKKSMSKKGRGGGKWSPRLMKSNREVKRRNRNGGQSSEKTSQIRDPVKKHPKNLEFSNTCFKRKAGPHKEKLAVNRSSNYVWGFPMRLKVLQKGKK